MCCWWWCTRRIPFLFHFVAREVDGVVHGVRHVLTHPSHGIVHLPSGVGCRVVSPQFVIASSVEVHGTVDVEGEVRTRAGVRLPTCHVVPLPVVMFTNDGASAHMSC